MVSRYGTIYVFFVMGYLSGEEADIWKNTLVHLQWSRKQVQRTTKSILTFFSVRVGFFTTQIGCNFLCLFIVMVASFGNLSQEFNTEELLN